MTHDPLLINKYLNALFTVGPKKYIGDRNNSLPRKADNTKEENLSRKVSLYIPLVKNAQINILNVIKNDNFPTFHKE